MSLKRNEHFRYFQNHIRFADAKNKTQTKLPRALAHVRAVFFFFVWGFSFVCLLVCFLNILIRILARKRNIHRLLYLKGLLQDYFEEWC